jgi:hypothetical protein
MFGLKKRVLHIAGKSQTAHQVQHLVFERTPPSNQLNSACRATGAVQCAYKKHCHQLLCMALSTAATELPYQPVAGCPALIRTP